MGQYRFKIPHSRGMRNIVQPKSIYNANTKVTDMFTHAVFGRVAMSNNETQELTAKFYDNTLELDVPDACLDNVVNIEKGEKLRKYFKWLTDNIYDVTVINSNYQVGDNDNLVICNADTASIDVTLPIAASKTNRYVQVKKISVDNVVNILAADGDTIDGQASQTIFEQYAYICLASDGNNWYVVSQGLV